jgi:ATP-binding cassette, subfamily C, bacterial PrsD
MVGTRQWSRLVARGDFVQRAVRNGPRAKRCAVAQALRRCRGLLIAPAPLSGLINVLALAGSLYTLEIYNGILPSRSEVALALSTLAMVAFYATSGILDFFRARLLGEAAMRFDRALSARVFASHARSADASRREASTTSRCATPTRCAHSCQAQHRPRCSMCRGNLPPASPARRLRHGGRGPPARAHARGGARQSRPRGARGPGSTRAMVLCELRTRGGSGRANVYESGLHRRRLQAQALAARHASVLTAAVKAVRPALQSWILGTGAFLVIDGKMAAGAIFAASIILSRALAPLEMAAAHWRSLTVVRQCHARLSAALVAHDPPATPSTSRSRPNKSLAVERLSISVRSCDPVLRAVSFELQAGDGLVIIGPTGCGKSPARSPAS